MTGSGDNVHLLFPGQINELNRVSGHADREIGVFRLFWMLHSINQLLGAKYVNVQMMRSLAEVSVQHAYQIVRALLIAVPKRARADSLRIGYPVQGKFVRKLRHRVQGRQQPVLLRAV